MSRFYSCEIAGGLRNPGGKSLEVIRPNIFAVFSWVLFQTSINSYNPQVQRRSVLGGGSVPLTARPASKASSPVEARILVNLSQYNPL
jgi:hypothetical protein